MKTFIFIMNSSCSGTKLSFATAFLLLAIFLLNTNSSLAAPADVDAGFNAVVDNEVKAIAHQPNGKILIGGLFGRVSVPAFSRIARINPDGTLDPTFINSGGSTQSLREAERKRRNLVSAFRNGQFAEQLTNERDKLKTALEATRYGVITVDADFNIQTHLAKQH